MAFCTGPMPPINFARCLRGSKDHIIDQTCRTRVDKKRIEKKHTKPGLLQVNMPLRQCYIHQQTTKDHKKICLYGYSSYQIFD